MKSLTGCAVAIIGGLVLSAASLSAGSRAAPSIRNRLSQVAAPSIDIPSTPDTHTQRAVTLDDMVSLREVHEPRQSPDGQRIAFLVRQAFRECDCYRTALFVTAVQGPSAGRKLVEDPYLANIQWSLDGRSLSYLSSRGGSVQLWRVDLASGVPKRLFEHVPNRDLTTAHVAFQSQYLPDSGILDYRWSPDGRFVAFTAESLADPSIAAGNAKRGFLYDDTTMSAWDLVVGDWAPGNRPKQLWLYDTVGKHERLLWVTPSDWYTSFTSLLWSPGGDKLAFFHSTKSNLGEDEIGMVDIATGSASDIGSAGGNLYSPTGAAWSPDGRKIAYVVRPQLARAIVAESDVTDHSRKLLARDLAVNDPWLAWDMGRNRLLFLSDGFGSDHQQTGLYALPAEGGTPVRISGAGRLGDCDVPLKGRIACVAQSPTVPPRPSLVSVVDGGVRGLTEVNPELASVHLEPVQELRWKNSFGAETNGFLIVPRQRTAGVRVPLVIVAYGFDGEFVMQANQNLSTYPAQALARDGIAVLLFNYPRFEGWTGPDFERGSQAFGYGPLASIRAIIAKLDADGLIDPSRVGMMGHSLGGFWVQLGISQTNLFRAVELHNGGTDSEPGTYWEGGTAGGRESQEHVMGGPPYGDTLKNYLGYSMTLNADRIRAPVLMEYDALEAGDGMEYYAALRHYQVPVDFFVYPKDGHITEHPEHRFMSLQRNLDWFDFWLLDRENDAASKFEQYARWREFKAITQKSIVDSAPRAN